MTIFLFDFTCVTGIHILYSSLTYLRKSYYTKFYFIVIISSNGICDVHIFNRRTSEYLGCPGPGETPIVLGKNHFIDTWTSVNSLFGCITLFAHTLFVQHIFGLISKFVQPISLYSLAYIVAKCTRVKFLSWPWKWTILLPQRER